MVQPGGSYKRSGARRAAAVSLAVSLVMAAAKAAVGIASGSIAVISDALHSALDAGATVLTLAAVRLADRPPDRRHPYGHGRAENLAALAESALLILAGGFIAREAVQRLMEGSSAKPPWYAVGLVAASLVVDASRARSLRKAADLHDSPALAGNAANFAADALSSIAVLAGLALARLGVPGADPVAALAVVALVWAMGVKLGLSAVHTLMDESPEGLDDRLREAASHVEGVLDVSDIRVRRSGPQTLADITIEVGRTASVERSHEIARAVEGTLAGQMPGVSATARVAPSRAGEDVTEAVLAAAARVGLADQVHNVLTIRHPEGLWLLLHAKVDPAMPLSQAHGVADELEAELRREIADVARVEVHLEPREAQDVPGTVVSDERDDLVGALRRIAESHSPIVRCHEVAVSSVDGGVHVVLHCDAPPETPIEHMHAASLRVEAEAHRRFPGVITLTIHFEPLEQ
ncbi:MAG TPA: cation diffusion facilitator family transporter [Actinomycetota bacterium]|nr:cation diffusion facilitator family transporter [Actinomycetota bacterium]